MALPTHVAVPQTLNYQGQLTSAGVAVIKYADTSCTTTTTASATIGTPSFYVSLVIGDDGLPLVAYNDPSGVPNMILKVSRCANAFCAPYFRRL